MSELVDPYNISLLVLGLLVLGAAAVPPLLCGRPGSYPLLCVGLGILLFLLPLDWPSLDPRRRGALAEHLAELAVIVALMGAGLLVCVAVHCPSRPDGRSDHEAPGIAGKSFPC